ncbi:MULTISPECIES: GTPase Era [Clostridium]|uniref:GTPase Era n=1 Tax=Clostridium novyi (strain NT) TaxID=386415 RepID=ERA_CLONN|nr:MULTISPECIES: GTPase Era [Clostridium]A0Q1Q0.1 RecName: Full=GTPase Era [Clostridium novyi NT]ABK62249.1 GTP-binding protein Era [Clostridium novyi NT]KEH85234.1 GTPase Era [Clostridium novyi A str. 4540]KEH87981.1 GTPase Era [Clostridium novyi A str. NCTC 538]KEH91014.1 GTPase Era [Clostridium novyi A str. BKT29909]KEH92332.1 GTPase Era [Clostridium botulinum C/D str. It1]
MFKSGFISIIGRPNVGKSTLTNEILGEKLSIVSCRPQTTRNNIRAVLTRDDYQLVFLDTPGIHKPRHKLGEYMVKAAETSTDEVDLIVFITTPEGEISKGDELILEGLKNSKKPVFLVINKIDENPQELVAKTLKQYSEYMDFAEIIPISARKSKNVDTLLELMIKYMPEGPKYYPEDMITDVQERFVVSEIIREKALKLLSEEVPHGIAVEIISMKQSKRGTYHIDANLLCEKDSHKGIIIGKGGQKLKTISTYARQDIEKFLDAKVNLKVWVKVKKEWRDSNFMLKELGYKE